jgi:hypothetical protein
MVTCEKCGTKNLDGARYCDDCGAFMNVPFGAVRSVVDSDDEDGADGHLLSESVPPNDADGEAKQPSQEFAISQGSISLMDGAHAKLVIERGRSAGKQFPLGEDESQIGRWDADGGIFPDVDLDADDPEAKVSRRHAQIIRQNGRYMIEDLGSTNGTFVNRGRRLLPGDQQSLSDGDEIIVGKTFLRFHIFK